MPQVRHCLAAGIWWSGVSDGVTEFLVREMNSNERTDRAEIELVTQIFGFWQDSREPKTFSLLVPIER